MDEPSSFYYIPREMGTSGTNRVPSVPLPIRFIPNPGTSGNNPVPSVPIPIRFIPTPVSQFPLQQSSEQSSFHIASSAHLPVIPVAVNACSKLGNDGTKLVQKKKRGRPRKYVPEGSVGLALCTSSGIKRKGRPPGTGTKQQLASFGEWVAGSAGMGFTPHVIRLSVGEDIYSKIMSLSQLGPRGICVISANGVVSRVTLCQPSSSGTITYEGRFVILTLSGSYVLTATEGGTRRRTGGLSISLSSHDGRVFGGNVSGMLIAAAPIQVIVGSFIYAGARDKMKENEITEPAFKSEQHFEVHSH